MIQVRIKGSKLHDNHQEGRSYSVVMGFSYLNFAFLCSIVYRIRDPFSKKKKKKSADPAHNTTSSTIGLPDSSEGASRIWA